MIVRLWTPNSSLHKNETIPARTKVPSISIQTCRWKSCNYMYNRLCACMRTHMLTPRYLSWLRVYVRGCVRACVRVLCSYVNRQVRGTPDRPPLIDPSKARELFRLGSSSGSLTLTEIEVIFRAFDANGKCHFTYLTVWQRVHYVSF